MKRLLLLIFTFGLVAGPAYAHNGMEHVMGTVTATSASSVSVRTINGTIQVVALTAETKFLKGDTAMTQKDIKVGDHIVIHAARKEGKLVAAEVKVGAMHGMQKSTQDMDTSAGKTRSH